MSITNNKKFHKSKVRDWKISLQVNLFYKWKNYFAKNKNLAWLIFWQTQPQKIVFIKFTKDGLENIFKLPHQYYFF